MSKGFEIDFEADHFEEDFFKEHEGLNMVISEGKDIFEKAEELHSILKTYFEGCEEELTKCTLYFSYTLQIPEMLSSCFLMNPCLNKNQSEREIKLKNLKAAEICLKILLTYLECPQTADATKSIIETSISVLHQAYNHCKDSEAIYGEFLEEFTNELGSFYKNIQGVQKVTLEKLDVLLNSDLYDQENDSASIILVSRGIGQLCELVTTLDQNVALIFWKVFLKILSKYKDIVLEKIEVDVFLLPLVLSIEDIVSQCVDCIKLNEKIIESEIKLCIMELSLLKKIIQIFSGHLKQNIITYLRNLSLQLFNLLVLSHSHTVAESKDLGVIRILLKTVKHAIIPFFSDSMFFTSILHFSQKDLSPGLQVPLILLKLIAVDSLKSYPEHSELLQKGALLVEIFSTLQENTPDDDLKLVCLKIPTTLIKECSKESVELTTAYHHCYTCLAEHSKVLINCSDIVSLFDKSILDIFTSSSDVVSLLISDVWMYYLRCGEIDNVYKHCNSLAKILKQMQNLRMEQLLTRMLKLLPDDFKIRLFEENENLYRLLGSNKILYRFNPPQLEDPSVLNEICSERIIPLIHALDDHSTNNLQKMIQKTCCILEFCTYCVDNLSSTQLLKFIEFASIVFKSDIFEIKIAVIFFLKSFSGKKLSSCDKEFDSLTSTIAQLLSDMMQSQDYIIRLEALHLYLRLAESTPHPEIVKKTVIKCPGLVPLIKSYAEKIPPTGFLTEETKHTMFQKQLAGSQLNNTFKYQFSDDSKKLLSDLFT